MILQTLLVSKDDLSAEALIQVLAQFGIAVERPNTPDAAVAHLANERFDQVVVDFDDPEAASLVLEACRRLPGAQSHPPVTVALLHDASQIRSILGAGAHFILTRPIAAEQAQNTFRAATALLKRERQQLARVAVQAAVSIQTGDGNKDDGNKKVEGILLELSNQGMEVLAAQPLPSGAPVGFSFELPNGGPGLEGKAKVAWSIDNGQTGLRALEMDAKMRQEMSAWLAARSDDTLLEEPDAVSECKLTDLSLSGCYVQTESPFPQSSAVDLCLRAVGMEIHIEGLVRVMHPGHGMGIEFPAGTGEQRQRVGEFIDFLTAQPGATPQLETSPRSLVARVAEPSETSGTGNGADDPLLELLRRGNMLEEDAFLEELHRQRTPAALGQ